MSDPSPVEVLNAVVGDGLTVEDLKDAVKIDVNALVDECAIQPYYYAVVGKMWADAKVALKILLNEDELIRSAVDSDIRKEPEEYDVGKITEKSVAAAVVVHEEVVKSKSKLEKAEANMYAAQVLLNVFDHRKAMLKGEVELFTTNLYNETNIRNKEMGGFRDEVAQKRAEKHERNK